jgi:DNA repair protein RadC
MTAGKPQPKRRRNKQTADLETITRYRVALVQEEQSPYGDLSLSNPSEVAKFLGRILNDRPQEHMVAVYLDTRNRLIGWTIAHVGTLNRAAVEPRTIFQVALSLNAAGLILAHNHPSGDPSPSAEDLAFTRRMAEAGDLLGTRLVDHLILGEQPRWISLRQRGGW